MRGKRKERVFGSRSVLGRERVLIKYVEKGRDKEDKGELGEGMGRRCIREDSDKKG